MVPGTYSVVVKYGGHEAKGTVTIEADPELKGSPAGWAAWDAAVVRAGALQNAVADAINRIGTTRKDVNQALAKLDARNKEKERDAEPGTPAKPDPSEKALRQSARDLQKKLSAVERRFYVPADLKGLLEDDTTALSEVENVRRAIGNSWEAPAPNTAADLEEADATTRAALADLNKLYAEDVPAFRKQLADAKIDLLGDAGPIEIGGR